MELIIAGHKAYNLRKEVKLVIEHHDHNEEPVTFGDRYEMGEFTPVYSDPKSKFGYRGHNVTWTDDAGDRLTTFVPAGSSLLTTLPLH